ncbi:MAG: hypothetical protein ABI921_13980, partial [Panacibacter sp.]
MNFSKKQPLFVIILIVICCSFTFFDNAKLPPLTNFSNEWSNAKYKVCNTAAKAGYMSDPEKELIYILNLARMNPKLFCTTVVKKYPDYASQTRLINSAYFISLVDTMSKLQPLQILYPDSLCYNSAQCHAYHSGLTGYTGHKRDNDTCENRKHFNGECCDYGYSAPLDIVMALLIDEGVESLGHRSICLGFYKRIGV